MASVPGCFLLLFWEHLCMLPFPSTRCERPPPSRRLSSAKASRVEVQNSDQLSNNSLMKVQVNKNCLYTEKERTANKYNQANSSIASNLKQGETNDVEKRERGSKRRVKRFKNEWLAAVGLHAGGFPDLPQSEHECGPVPPESPPGRQPIPTY
ncbi:hypothetical protein AVEN_215886-1 [Araneus ventricosus]|uniref:Uncharacterized protein n=1 Tax=Araneus ventricosus TaxID=182803 RepID=A0A4Y2HGS5_ARAVE|nr:hypothetical protein AVEN_215886-1 [Araneus ventricosus]